MNTFAFTLDLSKTAYMEPLRIRQGDQNGTTVQATILDHGVALEGSYTARFCMRHPGTGATYYRETGTYANGVATVALDEQYAASVPGRTTAYIQLLQGSTVIASTSDIPVVILHDATEDAVPGEVYDSAIEDALAELDEATGRISIMVQEQVAEELAAHPEWTTTVQDNSVTDAKLIQSGGILSRNARLMYRLANLLTHRTDEGTLAAISDAAKTPMAGLSVYGLSTQDGTPTPSAPVAIESVAGNILDPAQVFGGASYYTVNADGSVTVTAEDSRGWSDVPAVALPAGTYSATIDGNAGGRVICHVYANGVDTPWEILGNGSNTFTLAADGEAKLKVHRGTFPRTVRIALYAGSTASPYVPYGHAGLWARGKNLYHQTVRADGSSETVNGATFTYVGENSMAVSGSPTSNTWKPMSSTETNAGYYVTLPAGTYTASKGTTLGRIFVRKLENGAQAAIGNSAATSYTFTLTEPTRVAVTFAAQASETYSNVLVHLQIERGSTATAYQPYTATVTPIDLDGHELRSLPDGTRDELTVDERGHAVLVQRVQLTTQAVTDGVTGTVGVDVMSSTGEIANGATVLYPLATPVTIDLGTVPLVPLVGPDLTAQTVPSAPFVLDAERDLNVTLARLESAIAALA